MLDIVKTLHSLNTLVIFKPILKDSVINSLYTLLGDINSGNFDKAIISYSEFVSNLYQHNCNFSEYLMELTLESENIYIVKKGRNEPIDTVIEDCLLNELNTLQLISNITCDDIVDTMKCDSHLPKWYTSQYDFVTLYKQRAEEVFDKGYGIYAKYHVFTVKNGEVSPVISPDPIKLSQLSKYEAERQEVIDNTLALINGKPASNALLYGDCGTGKSSTVKACANEFYKNGLRLIEIKKQQLTEIPQLLETINKVPLKFILFIDDLSFSENDDNYAALKAILEGSVSTASSNSVIYATSNRRHLIKENFSDRNGDDIHFNDTLSELLSLSDRFGLTVTFSTPDKKVYLQVVESLANEYEIEMPIDEVLKQAEAFALYRGGRSPRTAKHFIEQLKSKE